ncbi:MAG: YfaZ family outer membrane protein [Steroidobacteraceae bacterium]|jgi:hypothetical protein|nr:YfaZ family outer membrane protein [Steroidobacteraceae bacterium]
MRMTAILAFGVSILASSGAFAQASPLGAERPGLPALEFTLSDETLQAEYLRDARPVNIERGELSAGVFLSEERDIVGMIGLLAPADLDLGRLSLSFGPRAYAALLENEDDDVLALSLGVEARFDVARARSVALAGHAYYAPDILTFGSADNVTDLMARAELRATERIIAFIGMRWFEMDLVAGGSRELQEELIVGVHWRLD